MSVPSVVRFLPGDHSLLRCAYCGSTHDVDAIMTPEGWPLCRPCERSNGAELLRLELHASEEREA